MNRRRFLKGTALGTATFAAAPASAAQQRGGRGAGPVPSPAQLATDTGGAPPPAVPAIIVEHPASDFTVDVIKALGIEYVAANPGSSFDSIQESIVNYGGNSKPEFLTCCHEESSVAMAHGYAKIEGKPMMALLHGTVGIQHAAMAIYNAYGDRVPVVMIAGNGRDAVLAHAAQDMAAMVRDYLKWDNQPESPGEVASSLIRAYRLAITPPMAPVLVVLDNEVQLSALNQPPRLPRITTPVFPGTDIDTVKEIARQLVSAQNPRIAAGRSARSQKGIDLLVQLADLLQASVSAGGDRVNFPSRHRLAGNGSGQPDLILGLEGGGGGAGGARTITISTADFLTMRNYESGNPALGELAVAADPEATLPSLIEEIRRLITPDRRRIFDERGAKHAEANRQARLQAMEAARHGWEASPISLARLAAELWPLIKNEDWSLVSPQGFIGNWPNRLWDFSKHYQYIGGQGAGGMGYGAPAAVGAALANRKYGRLSINIQTDGDLNYAPGVLWTAAHHKIPLLTIMHNNRAYHQEFMFMQRMVTWHNRGADRAHIGTTLSDPNIDYAQLAKAYGMYGEGPITDPKELAPALKRGIDRVKRGEPVLIDVITQPR